MINLPRSSDQGKWEADYGFLDHKLPLYKVILECNVSNIIKNTSSLRKLVEFSRIYWTKGWVEGIP